MVRNSGQIKKPDRETPLQGKYCAVPPAGLFRTADGLRVKGKGRLCVLHLGFCDESVFANVVHEALFLGNLLITDFLLPAGLVVLHRGCPDKSIFTDKVEVALFALDLFFSNFGSHLNTSKPLLGFDNES